MNRIIDEINKEQMTRELPEFAPGDTVVVNVKVKEGNRERLQAFEGVFPDCVRGLHVSEVELSGHKCFSGPHARPLPEERTTYARSGAIYQRRAIMCQMIVS